MAQRALKGVEPKAAAPSKPKILIYGPPGVGKTWASIDFPNVYYIDTEGGADLEHYTAKLEKAGGRYFGPKQGSLDFNAVIEEVITLATTEHGFKTLVIDSMSKLYNTFAAEAAEKGGDEFGRDKKEANKPTRKLIRWLDKLDMNAVLICHQKDKWSGGEMVGRTFDGWEKLEYELHLSLQIEKQGARRVARVMKSRLTQFPDATVFDWSYGNFADTFGRAIIEGRSVPIILATESQVLRLKELIGAIRVETDVTDKWLDRAGVESFPEMDTETIAKCIAFLEAKLPKNEELKANAA